MISSTFLFLNCDSILSIKSFYYSSEISINSLGHSFKVFLIIYRAIYLEIYSSFGIENYVEK